jgi:hypothetical protein
MGLEKLASAIQNNVMGGLRGATVNLAFTMEQIEDSIVNERMQIIKEYAAKNIIPINDLTYAIRCIKVDCESLDRCPCKESDRPLLKHFEIPQVFTEFGASGIDFVGSSDGLVRYKVYTNTSFLTHKHKRRGADKPYVYIDLTPNKNNRLDGFIFNTTSVLSELLVKIIPKDVRQLDYECCTGDEPQHNISFIDNEIERRLTEKFLRWYRQTPPGITPNDQTVK